jgi:hypothetical protein
MDRPVRMRLVWRIAHSFFGHRFTDCGRRQDLPCEFLSQPRPSRAETVDCLEGSDEGDLSCSGKFGYLELVGS